MTSEKNNKLNSHGSIKILKNRENSSQRQVLLGHTETFFQSKNTSYLISAMTAEVYFINTQS